VSIQLVGGQNSTGTQESARVATFRECRTIRKFRNALLNQFAEIAEKRTVSNQVTRTI